MTTGLTIHGLQGLVTADQVLPLTPPLVQVRVGARFFMPLNGIASLTEVLSNLVPEYLSDKFAGINTIHRHNLRGGQNNLFIPRPNTEALKKSFRYRGAVTWNSLSAEAKSRPLL